VQVPQAQLSRAKIKNLHQQALFNSKQMKRNNSKQTEFLYFSLHFLPNIKLVVFLARLKIFEIF
jgi:hypothetical protein